MAWGFKGGWTARWPWTRRGQRGCGPMATGSTPRPSRRISPRRTGCCWRSQHVGRSAKGDVSRLTVSGDQTAKAADWPPLSCSVISP